MVKIHDIRNRTPRTNGTRKLSQVKNIARHHSATAEGNFDSFMRHWKDVRGWGTGGYHEIILRDGSVELCYDPNEITNGVAGLNSTVYNICMVGNGSFTEAQEKAFDVRAKAAMKLFGLPASAVKGHGEFPRSSTTCPGTDMNAVRKRLANGTLTTPKPSKPAQKPVSTPAKLVVDGYLGVLTIKALQRYFKTPVDGVLSKPSMVVKAMQKMLGTAQDGYISEPYSNMVAALQRRYSTVVDGKISKPSLVIKELQRRLNNGKL